MAPLMASRQSTVSKPGVLDLYRSLIRFTDQRVGLERISLAVAVALLGAFVVLETVHAGRPVWAVWTLGVMAVSVVTPATGLLILVAIAPIGEPWLVVRNVCPKPF